MILIFYKKNDKTEEMNINIIKGDTMTQADMDEILSMAGMDVPDNNSAQKEWADKQMTNQPKIENALPEPSINDFQMVAPQDQGILDLSNRLNGLLGSDFSKDMKIERLQ